MFICLVENITYIYNVQDCGVPITMQFTRLTFYSNVENTCTTETF